MLKWKGGGGHSCVLIPGAEMEGGEGGPSCVLIPGAEMEGGRGALLCPSPWS